MKKGFLNIGNQKSITIWLFIVLACFFLWRPFFIYIPPGSFAIKKINLGQHKGLKKTVYDCGYTFLIPGFQELYTFPKTIQVLDLSSEDSKSFNLNLYTTHRSLKATHIQTSDGFFVTVDVSILFRIVDPYLVASQVGVGDLYWSAVVIPKCEPALKQALGELTTEEFYNSPLRVQAASEAKVILQKEFKEKGLQVEQVLVRYFRYSDEIQKNIEEKKLKDQMVFRNQAETAASLQLALLKKVEEEGKALVKIKLEEGRAYYNKKQAEREYYKRSIHAKADLLVKKAHALSEKLKNDAYDTPGAQRRLTLKMADVLKGIECLILPSTGQNSLNVLDIKSLTHMWDKKEA